MIGLGHLGARVNDVVDDRLPDDERRRAHEHLAACDQCQRIVTQQRQQRRAAAALVAVDVPDGLQQRLLALAASSPLEADTAPWSVAAGAGSAGASPAGAPGAGQPGANLARAGAAGAGHTARTRFVVVAAASVAGLGVVAAGGLFALGKPQPWTPDTFADVAALAGGGVGSPSGSAPGEATSAVWPSSVAAPLALPASSGVTRSEEMPTGAVRVDVVVGGVPVVVVEGPGRLEVDGLSAAHVLADGVEVFAVEGWWTVQGGREVIACAGQEDACLAVLQAFETAGQGIAVSITDRLGQGWRVVTGG